MDTAKHRTTSLINHVKQKRKDFLTAGTRKCMQGEVHRAQACGPGFPILVCIFWAYSDMSFYSAKHF